MRQRGLRPLNGEITDGRVPMSEIPKWSDSLTGGDNPFSQQEFDRFFDYHLFLAIKQNCSAGLSEQECYDKIYKELFEKGEVEPDDQFETFVKKEIRKAYININE